MNEDENVVQLQEEMRIKAAFDELKDDDEATQRDACNRFEHRFGADLASRLRDKLGLVEPKPAATVKPEVVEAAVKAVVDATKPKVRKIERVPLRSWAEVVVPEGTSELEGLTYVPGLVGDITEWIIIGAKRPNRMMALGTAIVVVDTLCSQRVIGPTDSGTHLYIIIIAPPGYGKDWPLQCGARLMEELGLGEHLGPSEWASSPGLWKRLRRNPVLVCFVDELGDELALVNSQGMNAFVSKIIGALKKCWNAFSTHFTAEKVSEESEKIVWPSPSIIGASTAEKFYGSINTGDLESGFANRLLILPMEGFRRPPEQLTPRGAGQPPKELVRGLRRLWRPLSLLDKFEDQQEAIGWGEGAGEIYLAFSGRMDKFESVDNMKYQLGMRVCESSVRLATVVACGRGSPTVDREDIEWALRLGELSFGAACSNYPKYVKDYYEFPVFCRKIHEALTLERMTDRDLERRFRRNQRWGNEYERAMTQLKKEKLIRQVHWRDGERGPVKEGWEAVSDEG